MSSMSISDMIFNAIIRVCVRRVIDIIFDTIYNLIFGTSQDEDVGKENQKTAQVSTCEHTQASQIVKKNNSETVQSVQKYSQPSTVVPSSTVVIKRTVTNSVVRNQVLVPVIKVTVTTTWS